MTLRLLYLADVRFPIERANGIQTMETCAALAERGHEVRLVVRPDTQRPARDPFAYYGVARHRGLRIEAAAVAGPPAVRRAQFLARALASVASSHRDTLVFTRDLGVASLILQARPLVRRRVIYESHGFAPTVTASRPTMLTGAAETTGRKQRRLARREERVWRKADGYITITRALAEEMVERLGPRPALAVIHDGVRLDPAAVWHPPAPEMKPVIGYAGHLYPWKGAHLLLEGLRDLPAVEALIIGGHPAERDLGRLQELAAREGLSARVRFTGHVAPREVPALLRLATILVLPNPAGEVSMRYTSPLKLFEYLASGRPVVASDLPSFREILSDSENALLFQAGDAKALAAAVTRLVRDEGLAARIGRRGFETAQQYSWGSRAERIETLVTEAMSSSGTV